MSFETLSLFRVQYRIHSRCRFGAIRSDLISQSATVKQRNDDANYQQNGQHSDNDHAVTALYIRVEIANLPPDLLDRKALFVLRFFVLNMFLHVESPRRPNEMDALESRNRIVVFCSANPVRPLMSTHLDRRVGVLVYASSVPTSIH